MSGISAENLARLTSASEAQKDAALEAVLDLATTTEDNAYIGQVSLHSGILARRFRIAVEEALT